MTNRLSPRNEHDTGVDHSKTAAGCAARFADSAPMGQYVELQDAEALATRFANEGVTSDKLAAQGGQYESTKPVNPKDSIGATKIPLHLWPETATILGAMGLLDGALKYGRSNYRATDVRASIYYDAAKRHLNAWFEGRECDPDSGLPDLAHALACLAIIIDAEAHDTLIDDRMYCRTPGYLKLLAKMTPFVKALQERHADKAPHHYTRGDIHE